jgi:hypothetical protein
MKYRYKLDNDIKLVELCRVLSFNPQTLDEITDKMYKTFTADNREFLRSEIENMITTLVDDGKVEVIEPEKTTFTPDCEGCYLPK